MKAVRIAAAAMGRTGLAALMLGVAAAAASAQGVELPQNPPLPYAPPQRAGTIPPFAPEMLRSKGHLAVLQEGLSALSRGDLAGARGVRAALKRGSVERDILGWAIALSGHAGVGSEEIAQIARTLAGWPGMARLALQRERALARENPPAEALADAFAGRQPVTFEATVALARAHLALGDREAARAVLSPFWREKTLNARQELAIVAEFGDLIPAADHRYRMERMLYEERVRSAERMAGLVGGQALVRAWAAVIRNRPEAGALLEAVPESERSTGYLFAKVRQLRRSGQFLEAAEAMLSAPLEPDALIDPDAWWFERRVLSRELLDIGEARMAYRVAAAHAGGSPASQADAAFHAGWYALRSLGDANAAAHHFSRIAQIAEGPISRARAFYWLGRAVEAGGPGKADAYYRKAAVHGTTFYGQLAAARLGLSSLDTSRPQPSEEERRRFGARKAVQAIGKLEAIGENRLAALLYRDLAQALPSAGELALLAGMAEARGDHHLALRIAKTASARGLETGMLTHPLGAIPESAVLSGSGEALAYAIARQESEFNAGAVSGAGARGLLQLMPATARAMAAKTGLAYAPPRLTADAGYNATLGAAYLGEQLDRFDGSYILTFVGYNAGPRRAEAWIARYGDPRGRPVEEVVDWIERIPFTETRNYVQRVMESYQVYKAQLGAPFDIEHDLVMGR